MQRAGEKEHKLEDKAMVQEANKTRTIFVFWNYGIRVEEEIVRIQFIGCLDRRRLYLREWR